MSLKIYNTLTQKKEEFIPLKPNEVGMYVCGVTVYDYCHLGHARAAVVFDVIYRYLKYSGYNVKFVRNFTDVDDKIIKKANEEKVECQVITERYIEAFYEDMGMLNIERPNIEPKATGHIPEMISMIESLVRQGYAYPLEGDVYFEVKKFSNYGRLSKKNIEELVSGARVEVDERKKSPLDFALWKKSLPYEPAWDSPWGKGRPGWHIECSAMSRKYLGETFDIHGGGQDLIFPHHENEIAQSEGSSGKSFVKFWIHNGFVNINKEKMSKSLGNFFTIREILKKYHPEVIRFFLLSVHYRSPIDFSFENLEQAKESLDRVYECLEKIAIVGMEEKNMSGSGMKDFAVAMDNDFNTASVLAIIFNLVREVNSHIAKYGVSESDSYIKEKKYEIRGMGAVLGLFGLSPEEYRQNVPEMVSLNISFWEEFKEKIDKKVEERKLARQNKDWVTADRIKKELAEQDVVIQDTPAGPKWMMRR